MNQGNERYWNPCHETLYEAYFQELASGALIGRWQLIDIVTLVFVAVTATGSAISGWAFWAEPGFRYVWLIIAGVVSIASAAHGVMGVSGRIKDQEELRRDFAALRVDTENFRQNLAIGISTVQAQTTHETLQQRLAQVIGRARKDIAFTGRFRSKVQDELNQIMRDKGYIE